MAVLTHRAVKIDGSEIRQICDYFKLSHNIYLHYKFLSFRPGPCRGSSYWTHTTRTHWRHQTPLLHRHKNTLSIMRKMPQLAKFYSGAYDIVVWG